MTPRRAGAMLAAALAAARFIGCGSSSEPAPACGGTTVVVDGGTDAYDAGLWQSPAFCAQFCPPGYQACSVVDSTRVRCDQACPI